MPGLHWALGHMMMLEKDNLDIAALISRWIQANVEQAHP